MTLDYSPLERALAQLEKSYDYLHSELSRNDPDLRDQFRAATIQAFEYTYELSHKMLKRYLEMTSPNPAEIDQMTFQTLIRTGSEQGLLKSGWDRWRDYRKARATTSHTYDEAKALEVLQVVPDFMQEARYLLSELRKRAED
jgi:nucleotidyltransferase substrate binding protein (TIGR01987 family)